MELGGNPAMLTFHLKCSSDEAEGVNARESIDAPRQREHVWSFIEKGLGVGRISGLENDGGQGEPR